MILLFDLYTKEIKMEFILIDEEKSLLNEATLKRNTALDILYNQIMDENKIRYATGLLFDSAILEYTDNSIKCVETTDYLNSLSEKFY